MAIIAAAAGPESEEGAGVPAPDPAADIARSLAAVRARIEAAARAAGRDPGEVTLLPVSKTVAAPRLRQACAAGVRALAENKVQEARAKAEALADLGLRWSIVGHLQTNKARDVARFAHEVQSLDSLRLAEALERRCQVEGRGLDVLIQVNSSGEASKYGLTPEEVPGLARQLPAFAALKVRGLMTLALFSADRERVRACFARARALAEQLRQEAPGGLAFDELSMGMSGDLELAVAEGATIVRVGQAIFGPRPTPDSHYWPGA